MKLQTMRSVVAMLAALAVSLAACGDGGPPTVTADQAQKAQLGISKADASSILSGPGKAGAYTEESGPSSGQKWEDCWFYAKTGGHRLVVCFDGDVVGLLVGDWHGVPGAEEIRSIEVTGDALTPLGEGNDPAVGSPAPELAGARFDGTPLHIRADGQAKVLVFVAHWCPHCQLQVSQLAEWLARNGTPDEVELYGIATATSPDRPNYPPSTWLVRARFTLPTLADDRDGSAARAFGITAFPSFVAIDRENRVVARVSGELTIGQWEDLLDRVRTGP